MCSGDSEENFRGRKYVRMCVCVLFVVVLLLHLQGDHQSRVTGLVSISVLGQMRQSSVPAGKKQGCWEL